MKVLSFIFVLVVGGAFVGGVGRPAGRAPAAQDPSGRPAAGFHHVHLNTTDPRRAIDFYNRRFESSPAKFAGRLDAVQTPQSWLLFNRVGVAPPWELTSAIWHIGWGAEDMPAEYERQLKIGTRFFEPLTDISDIGGNPNARPGSFYYAYVESPDRALIELNTAPHHHFGHLHLFSADPIAAGDWYTKYFGVKRRSRTPSREPRFYRGLQIGPSVSFVLDQVNVIIFPVEYARKAYADHWRGRTELEPTRGRAIDHLGIRVDDLNETLSLMRQDGVKVTAAARPLAGRGVRSAFIEGPDRIGIELVEDRSNRDRTSQTAQ
ncbi:MAG: hypothetical protein EBZ36_04575 [Acidobacteria bacterium]|nr:hypothetical protein [Acidobacteriota bacterium]